MVYTFIVLLISWLFIAAQLVYFHIFGTSLSLSQFGMGTDAVTSFWRELLAAMGDIWYQLLFLLVPFILFILFSFVKKPWRGIIFGWKKDLIALALVVVTYGVSLGMLFIGGTSAYSCYDLYHSSAMSTDLSVKGLGVMTTARLEIKYMLFGSDENLSDVLAKEGEQAALSDTDIYNMLEIDFDAMAAEEKNSNVKALDEYFSTAQATKKNDYTGYFKGYNLIELCCESFSPVFIDKELTPMLYKMYHGGFVFRNFYSPWESNTTNGKYTMCMGLFPDNSRSKSNGSFITDKVRYNSSTGEVEYLVEESRVTDSYIESWIEEVKRRFAISTEILNTDYYRYVMEALEQPPKNTAEASETDDAADTEKSENNDGEGNRRNHQPTGPTEDY